MQYVNFPKLQLCEKAAKNDISFSWCEMDLFLQFLLQFDLGPNLPPFRTFNRVFREKSSTKKHRSGSRARTNLVLSPEPVLGFFGQALFSKNWVECAKGGGGLASNRTDCLRHGHG